MLYVKRVETNAKRYGAAVDLGPKTLIVGDNGTGKSTILDALTLATNATVLDLAGRPSIVKESEIISILPRNQEVLFAQAILSDDRVCTYEIKRTPKGATRRAHVKAVDVAFPVSEARAALVGNMDTARKWLLHRLADRIDSEAMANFFHGDLWTLYQNQARLVERPGATTIDTLTAVFQHARSRLLKTTSAVTTVNHALGALGQVRNVPPKASAAHQQRIAEAEKAALRQAQLDGRISQTQSQLERLRTSLVSIEATAKKLEANVVPEPEVLPTNVPELDAALWPVIVEAIQADRTDCPACGSPFVLEDLLRRQQRMEQVGSVLAARQARDAWETEAMRVVSLLEQRQQEIAAAEVELRRLQAERDAIVVPDVEALRQEQAEMLVAQREYDRAHELRTEKTQLEKTASEQTRLVQACRAAMSSLVETAHTEFVHAVQSFLPDGYIFDLELVEKAPPPNEGEGLLQFEEDAGREVCRFGLRDPETGTLRTAVSGAEWALLNLAVGAAAITPARNRLYVLVPEERDISPETLALALKALARVPGQVILMTTTPPKGRVPKDWTVIHTPLKD